MLIRLFRSDVSYQILIILFLSGLLWFDAFLHPPAVVSSNSSLVLYNKMSGFFSAWPLLSVITGFVIMIVEAIFLNLILSIHDMTPRNSALAAILYIIFVSWSPVMLTINPMLICNAVLLIFLYMLLKIFETKDPYEQIFSAAFSVALAVFIDISVVWLLLMMMIGMMVYRIFSWREWFISLIGFVLPFYFVTVYFFLNNQFQDFTSSLLKIFNPGYTFEFHFNWITSTFLIIFASLMAWTIMAVLNTVREKVIAIRKKYITMIWFFLIALLCIPLPSPEFPVRTTFLFLPAASLVSYYFSNLKKLWLMEIVFGTMFLMIVLNRF